MAKAVVWAGTDAEERKRGERTGLDTLVVHLAVNAGCSMSDNTFGILANALNTPPEYYNRKV